LNFIIKYIYDCFHESRVNKKKRGDFTIWSSQNTIYLNSIFFSLSLFFSHLCFSSIFFQISIPSCNIIFIWDWASYFFSIYFLWGYISLMTRTTSLTRFTQVFFPFPDLFSQFYPSILSWFRIRLLDLFWFEFNDIIFVSWLRSRVSWVNLDWLELFFVSFFNIILNFNFIIQHYVYWKLNFIISFNILLWGHPSFLTRTRVDLDLDPSSRTFWTQNFNVKLRIVAMNVLVVYFYLLKEFKNKIKFLFIFLLFQINMFLIL
jgi:hypothetical protein